MNVPILICTRDLVTWTRQLAERCLSLDGVGDIFVIDNDSQFPPMVDWLETAKDVTVVRLTENRGPQAPYTLLRELISDQPRYVTTDCDLDLSGVPDNLLQVLAHKLDKLPDIAKAGPALRIDDVSLESKIGRLAHIREAPGWQHYHLDEGLVWYHADIGNTFALHNRQMPCTCYGPSLRVAGKYTGRHHPWYPIPAEVSEEFQFYLNRADSPGPVYTGELRRQLTQEGIERASD